MFTLMKEFRFEAAHQLLDHDGKCARLHGHSWKGRIFVQGPYIDYQSSSPKKGMLVDYSKLKEILTPIVDKYLDHRFLNETIGPEFIAGKRAPTSEVVAWWLFDKLRPLIDCSCYTLVAVEVDETCTSSCRYDGNEEYEVDTTD